MATTMVKEPPLGFMKKLSESVYVCRTAKQTDGEVDISVEPRLILMLGWMDARDAHLAKYLHEYQARYPRSTVLLIKSRFAVMTSSTTAQADVSAALPVMQEILTSARDVPELLVHTFSNGGSCLLSTLNGIYKQHDLTGLPLHITIFDSSPSTHYDRSSAVSAILAGVPRGWMRSLTSPVLDLFSYFLLFQIHVLGSADLLADLAASHNDRQKVRETLRVYIYSDADLLINQRDVEEHALEAQRNGFNVTEELFVGSPHVAHVRSDPDRYWKIVNNAWRAVVV